VVTPWQNNFSSYFNSFPSQYQGQFQSEFLPPVSLNGPESEAMLRFPGQTYGEQGQSWPQEQGMLMQEQALVEREQLMLMREQALFIQMLDTMLEQFLSQNPNSAFGGNGSGLLPEVGVGSAGQNGPLAPLTGDAAAPASSGASDGQVGTSGSDNSTQPESPPPVAAPGDSTNFFMTQFRSKFNGDGPSSSGTCGETSLAMLEVARGKLGPLVRGHEQDLINEVCKQAGVSGASTAEELKNAADKSGLNANVVNGFDAVDQALAQGKMAVALGNPKAYDQGMGPNDYAWDASTNKPFDGAHWILIVGKNPDGTYRVNDPCSKNGPLNLSRQQLENYMNLEGNEAVVA
jgi:hypothetical protein